MALNKLNELIDKIEKNISHFENKSQAISEASIGWHIAHTLKVLVNVTESIKNSNPKDFKSNFHFVRAIIFIRNKIPRGKGKAPKAAQPNTDISINSLQDYIIKARKSVVELYNLDKNKHFVHPYFGDVKLKGCIKFLTIHTNHHYKIIADIVKATL